MKDEEFNVIKGDLVNEIRGMRKDMDIFMKTLAVHDEALYGNRTDRPGCMEDVRTLKNADNQHKKNYFVIYSAIVAGIIERCFHYLTGHGPK